LTVKKEKDDLRARLEAERNDIQKRLQSTEKETQAKIQRLEGELAFHTNKCEDLANQLRLNRQELEIKITAVRNAEEKATILQSELADKDMDASSGQKREKDLTERIRQLEEAMLKDET
jgi:chromosome segregation ATPase